jgi:hypothetical protein
LTGPGDPGASSALVERRALKETKMEHFGRRFRLLAVTATLVLGFSVFAGTAAAATGEAPGTGLTGSCNMLLALGVGENGGLAGAFSVENVHGWDGKWTAVAVSGCDLQKP